MTALLSQLSENSVLRDSQRCLSSQQIQRQCADIAQQLQSNHIQTLALHCDNGINWVLVDLACQLANICLIPLPTFFSKQQLAVIIEQNPIDAMLCENPEVLTGLLRGGECCDKTLVGLQLITGPGFTTANTTNCYPLGTDKVTFTSGSTGSPKGVCLSNQQLLKQAAALNQATQLNTHRHLCLLPLSTLLENVAGIYAPLLVGGEVILPTLEEVGFEGSSSINAATLMQLISHYQPSSIIVTPQLLQLLSVCTEQGWQPPASLQFVAVGGAKVSKSLLAKARQQGIPAYEGYGLSECASVVSLNTANHQQPTGAGKPLSHLQLTVEKGELVVEGNAMLGYAHDPASWYPQKIYTGDLGSIDKEGFVHINGRKKNLLISSFGRNINPEWVESEVLANSLIAECIVLGDAKPYCIALITVRGDVVSDAKNTTAVQGVIDSINRQLPDYARIQQWQFLPQPLASQPQMMTENGRPKRLAIAEHYESLIESLYQIRLEELAS